MESFLFKAQKVQPEWHLNHCLEIIRDKTVHISSDSFKVLRVSAEEAQLAWRATRQPCVDVSEGSQNSIPPVTFCNLPPPKCHLAPIQRLQRSQSRPQKPNVSWKHLQQSRWQTGLHLLVYLKIAFASRLFCSDKGSFTRPLHSS